MKKNVKATLLSAFIFPGLGQIYKGCKLKGYLMILGANLLFLVALALVLKGVYELSLTNGISETPDPSAFAKRLIAETPSIEWILGIFFCLWLYGVLDALLAGRKERTP